MSWVVENFIIFHDKEELRKRSKYLSKKLHKHIEGFETIIIYNDSNGLVNTEWTFIQKTGSKILVDLNISSVNNENSDIIFNNVNIFYKTSINTYFLLMLD